MVIGARPNSILLGGEKYRAILISYKCGILSKSPYNLLLEERLRKKQNSRLKEFYTRLIRSI